MYYIGTVILHMSPTSFWKSSPRKFFALCREHTRLNTPDDKEQKAVKGNLKRKSVPVGKPDTFIDNVLR